MRAHASCRLFNVNDFVNQLIYIPSITPAQWLEFEHSKPWSNRYCSILDWDHDNRSELFSIQIGDISWNRYQCGLYSGKDAPKPAHGGRSGMNHGFHIHCM